MANFVKEETSTWIVQLLIYCQTIFETKSKKKIAKEKWQGIFANDRLN